MKQLYPKDKLIYPTLGLAGEAGEVCDKIKKIIRDKNGEFTQNDRFGNPPRNWEMSCGISHR